MASGWMRLWAAALSLALLIPTKLAAPAAPETVRFPNPEPHPLIEAVGHEIADAIRREAGRSGIPEELILGIIRTENPWLKPDTVNWYGAVGLMQITEWLHGGEYPECGDDLTDIDTNICYGVRIFENKLRIAQGDTTRALLYYNGCWGETYIPGCERYSDLVEARSDF